MDSNSNEYFASLTEAAQQWNSGGNLQIATQHYQGTCPSCGYCPHCGRSARPWYQPMPYYAPYYPAWQGLAPYVWPGSQVIC